MSDILCEVRLLRAELSKLLKHLAGDGAVTEWSDLDRQRARAALARIEGKGSR